MRIRYFVILTSQSDMNSIKQLNEILGHMDKERR